MATKVTEDDLVPKATGSGSATKVTEKDLSEGPMGLWETIMRSATTARIGMDVGGALAGAGVGTIFGGPIGGILGAGYGAWGANLGADWLQSLQPVEPKETGLLPHEFALPREARMGSVPMGEFPEALARAAIPGLAAAGGQAAGPYVGAAVRGGTRSAVRGPGLGATGLDEGVEASGARGVQQSIYDLVPFGAKPSVAQATGMSALDGLESMVAKIPGGHGRIRKVVQATTDKIGRAIEATNRRIFGRTHSDPTVAGQQIKTGLVGRHGDEPLNSWVGRFRAKQEALFAKLDEFIPADKVVSTKETSEMLLELSARVSSEELNKILTSPSLRALFEAIPETVPYGILKELRTAVGAKLSSPSLLDDVSVGEWKRVYGALSNDMKAALPLDEATGRPLSSAMRAWERANGYTRAGMTRIEEIIAPLIGNKVPEKIFAALEGSAKQGRTVVNAVRRSLDPEQWEAVAMNMVHRMGRAVGSQQDDLGSAWSFQTFLTNWDKYQRAGTLDAVFNTPGMRMYFRDLKGLARAANRSRESSKAFYNPSGTAAPTMAGSMVVGSLATGGTMAAAGVPGAWAALAIAPAVALGSNVMARLMTSKAFVHWLARATKIAPNGFSAHLGRLSAVAATADRDVQDAIVQYLKQFDPPEAAPPGAAPAEYDPAGMMPGS